MICHALPGRLRLRLHTPLATAELDTLVRAIKALAPSARVDHTPQTGSVLIQYAEKEHHQSIVALCSQSFAPPTPRRTNCTGSVDFRWPSMKVIKRGMSVSFLASLALLAGGNERGHAIAGSVFLTLLARHTWVYRKRL